MNITLLLKDALVQGNLIAFVLVFIAGVLTSFTPCVYPLVPIVVSYIGASHRQGGAGGSKSKLSGFILALAYSVGVAITYACLGMIAALSGSLFGYIQTSPITYMIVGAIIIIFGLSLMNLFVLPIPKFLRSTKIGMGHKGILGAFLLGAGSGLVAAPCTAAALGAILAYVATKQNVIFGGLLLFTFAIGMSVLLILVGTFTSAIMPKPGTWLTRLEKIFGIALVLFGGYFVVKALTMFFGK